MAQDAASRDTRREEEDEACMKLHITQGGWIFGEVDVRPARVFKPGEGFEHGRGCRITLDTRWHAAAACRCP